MTRRVLKIAAGVVLLAPVALVVSFFVYSRHVPYSIDARDRPPAAYQQPGQGLQVRFLGVTGYEVSDGTTVVLLDPTPTRPSPSELISGPLRTDDAHGKEMCPKADFILVNHTHFDHALDAPAIALRTGAKVLGSQSTVNLALSRGVPAERTQVVKAGDHLALGTFTVDVRGTRHADILGVSNPMAGTVAVNAGPLWFFQYGLDDTLFYRLEANGSSLWFHPTSTFAKGEVGGPPADAIIVGITGEAQTVGKLRGLLAESQAKVVLPTHYDNFFQPMQRGLALMPGLDLAKTRALFLETDSGLQWIVLDYGETIHLPVRP